MKTKTIFLFAIGLLLLISTYAQTHIPTGNVSGTWTAASSPYIIDGEITLDTLEQLIIEPGVDVEFSGHYKFIIYGRLLAEGTETDSIHITAQDTTVGWHGLRFDYTSFNGQDTSKLDYCRLDYGKAYGPTLRDSLGGAISCDSLSFVLINNSTLTNNVAFRGGAIYLYKSDMTVLNTSIRKNRTMEIGFGGGVYANSYQTLKFQNVIIENNSAFGDNGRGGGIRLFSQEFASVELRNVEIRSNHAGHKGGGIYNDNYNVNLIVKNCKIYNNESLDSGGGMGGLLNIVSAEDFDIYNNTANTGGGICWTLFNNCTMKNVNVFDNNAHKGGGIFCWGEYGSGANVSSTKIYNNNAEYGGGVYLNNCENSGLTNCEIYYNDANHGGGLVIEESETIELRNLTITENSANLGGSVRVVTNSSVDISSCILWNNTDEETSIDETSTCDVNYSLISGGYPGTGNIDMDPLFFYTNNEFTLKWDHYPEPDETKSPCIDTGDPFIPYDPDGTRIDMGAIPYEQTYTPLTAGNINGTLLCSESPYYVYGNLTIPDGDQLVIEPCVYMIFQGQYYLRVEGQLLAQGTETDKITFCAADSATGWSGIRFSGTSTNGQDSSKLENCRLFWGNVGDGGALYFEYSSDILVKDCHIFNNRASDQGGGIHLSYAAPMLINNTIENNHGKYGGGIYSYVGNYQVHGGVMQNNTAEIGGGIYQRGSSPQFHGVTFKNNYASNVGGGIYFFGNCSPVFYPDDRCNIYDNYAVVAGTDLYGNFSAGAHPNIYVDTFTVINPDKHFIYPYDEFTVDLLNKKNEQVAGDLFVSPTGDDSNSGTSEAEPLQTIYQALKIILPDPVIERTIHLATGMYSNSTTNENFPLNMRTDVTLNGGSKILVAFLGDSTTNFFYFFDDQNCKLKNIRFYGGTADNGGALNLNQYSTPEIDSVSFVYNTASGEGGAVFCDNYSDALISNALFLLNESDGNGGAIACKTGSSPTLNNCSFSSNTGYKAGGLYAKSNAHVSLTNVIFNNNSGRDGGGCWIDYDSDPVFTNVSFINNEATYGNGGGANFSYYSDPVLNNCVFRSNIASHGGGGFSIGSFGILEMNNSWITGNVAGYGGGLIAGSNSELTLRNVELTGNTATSTPYSNDEGGGLYLSDVDVSLINVTISDNLTTTDGGAIYCTQSSNISIHNGILWNNNPDGINIESGTVTAEYSDIEGGYIGTGNIDVNPAFHDILTYDYSLGEFSPCIDMGTPDTTGLFLPDKCLAGNPRIGYGRVDMGAFENYERMELELTVFLEGPFNGTDMNTDLIGNPELVEGLPLSQPYNNFPWNYSGSESVTTIPGTDIVDWVLIELRDAVNAGSAVASTMFTRMAGFLLSDGSIVNQDGTSNLNFYDVLNDQLYAVIWHRNHLGVMSANPVLESGGVYCYDFTTALGQAYNAGHKSLGIGIYGMIGGDANADGNAYLDDKTLWTIQAGIPGYLSEDFDMDGQVNNNDKNDVWLPNVWVGSQVPE